jgi:diguanylate cyclase (GGDEF)-like protein
MLRNLEHAQAQFSPRKFDPLVFVIATLAVAAILMSCVAIPQWLSKQARWEVLRSHVGQIGQLAASVVDGDLHRQLLDPSNYSNELYARALEPLVRFHSANSDLFYVYTMTVENHVPHFVLDTASSPKLRTSHRLRASGYMEPFSLRKEYEDGWLDQIASGKTYVTPNYEHDDYGYFLTAHVPIYDGQGRFSGFVGVDFDMQYYLAEESRFRVIEVASLTVAALASLLIGYLVALYYVDLKTRMRELYYRATRDDLTGLLNRRGAKSAVNAASPTSGAAMFLVDIDHLRMIIEMQGQNNGDAVVVRVADALRKCVGENDVCARVGESEFMIFRPHCDASDAVRVAEQILLQLSNQKMSIAGVKLAVTIGIATLQETKSDFVQLYRNAHAALYNARLGGKADVGIFEPGPETRPKKQTGLGPTSPYYLDNFRRAATVRETLRPPQSGK